MKKASLIVCLLINLAGTAYALNTSTKTKAASVLICQSNSAYAYQAYAFRGLARCTHRIKKVTKAQASKMGYKPCKICY